MEADPTAAAGLLARMQAMAERIHLDQAEPRPVSLVAGADIYAMINATAQPAGPLPGGPAMLTGIGVSLREDLEPGEWRLLDKNGVPLKAGLMLDGCMYVLDLEAMGADADIVLGLRGTEHALAAMAWATEKNMEIW